MPLTDEELSSEFDALYNSAEGEVVQATPQGNVESPVGDMEAEFNQLFDAPGELLGDPIDNTPAVDDRSDLDRYDAITGNPPELTVDDPLAPIKSTDVGDLSLLEPDDVQQNELANILVSNDPGVGGDVLDTEVSQLFPSDSKLEKAKVMTTEVIPALHEAYRKGDMKEKYGIEPGFFNLGMLTVGFMLNADPTDRTNMMKEWLGTENVYETEVDGKPVYSILVDGKVNHLANNAEGVSAQDFYDIALEAGAGVLAGIATSGMSFWGTLLAEGAAAATVAGTKQLASVPFGADLDMSEAAVASAEAGGGDAAINLVLKGMGLTGKAAAYMGSFAKKHSIDLFRQSEVAKSVQKALPGNKLAADIGAAAAVDKGITLDVVNTLIKEGKTAKEINSMLGTVYTPGQIAATETGVLRDLMKEYGSVTGQHADTLAASSTAIFNKSARFIKDQADLSSAAGGEKLRNVARTIGDRFDARRAVVGDTIQKALKDSGATVNFQKTFIEPMNRLRNKLAGSSGFEADITKTINAVTPAKLHEPIKNLRASIKDRSKEITSLRGKLGRLKTVSYKLPQQKIKQGGPKSFAAQFNTMQKQLDGLEADQVLAKDKLGEYLTIPMENISLAKSELNRLAKDDMSSQRALAAGLSRLNKILGANVPALKGKKGLRAQYAAAVEEITRLEASSVGKLADPKGVREVSLKMMSDTIFSVKDPAVIKNSLDMIHSVDPKVANAVVREQITKQFSLDDEVVELAASGKPFRPTVGAREEDFGVTPEGYAAKLNAFFKPGNTKARAIRNWVEKDPGTKRFLAQLERGAIVQKRTPEGGGALKNLQAVGGVESIPLASTSPVRNIGVVSNALSNLKSDADKKALINGFSELLNSNTAQAVTIRDVISDIMERDELSAANMAFITSQLLNFGRAVGKTTSAAVRTDRAENRRVAPGPGGDFIQGLAL
jgi:hypothetical protein